MNHKRIIGLLKRIANTNEDERERALALIERVSIHKAHRADIKKLAKYQPIRKNLANIDKLDQLISSGGKIISLDAEWTQGRAITEIGIAVLENGIQTTHNVVVGKFRKPSFHHGTTLYMDDDKAREWFRDITSDGKLLIGHALKGDRKQFQLWGKPVPPIPFIDTASWSRHISKSPYMMSLTNLALHCGLEHLDAHCAGNDAHMTMMVALRINQMVGS